MGGDGQNVVEGECREYWRQIPQEDTCALLLKGHFNTEVMLKNVLLTEL